MGSDSSQISTLRLDKKRIKKIVEAKTIMPTKTVEICLNEFFGLIKAEIAKCSPTMSKDKKQSLYFSKMKRFIYTAYTNLYEMDSKFFDEPLRQYKKDLQGLENINEYVKGLMLNIRATYQSVYLNKQKDFALVEKYLKASKSRLSALNANEKALKALMTQKEIELQNLSKNSAKYKDAEEILKKVKRQYADLSFELYSFRDEVQALARIRNEFEQVFFERFGEILQESVKTLEKGLLNILNHKAFSLDYDLWSKAKQSENIRQFFKVAKIDGGFSSKTYLKYFLKNLDENKSSEMQDDLRDILKYLEKMTQKDILILMNKEEEIEHFKYLIELADKDYVVKGFTRPFSALTYCHQRDFDLILIEYLMSDMDAIEFLEDFKYELPQKIDKTQFGIFLDNPTKREILRFHKIGIKPFFTPKSVKDIEFEEKILSILKGDI